MYIEFKEAGWSANYLSNLLKYSKNEIFGQNFDLLKVKTPTALDFDYEYFSYILIHKVFC